MLDASYYKSHFIFFILSSVIKSDFMSDVSPFESSLLSELYRVRGS